MGHIPNKLKPITTAAFCAAAGCGAVAMLAAAIVVVAPREAAATAAYAQQTGLACGQCHFNPAGGGKLKPLGKRFQSNGHKLTGK